MIREAFTPWFPEPGNYVKYWDHDTKKPKFIKLLWRRDPLRYPRRLPSVAADTWSSSVTFSELNPKLKNKGHIYLAYLGLSPGFLFRLWHPADIRNLKWDENVTLINEDLTGCLSYADSPIEYPAKSLGILEDYYPALDALNMTGETKTPEVLWIASSYKVTPHEGLNGDELARLESGALRSYPWDFGGEV